MNTDYSTKAGEMRADPVFRQRYETLRSVLYKNGTALQLMADLEADLNHFDYSDPALLRPLRRLLDESLLMAQELNLLTGDKYRVLYRVVEEIRTRINQIFGEVAQRLPQEIDIRLGEEGSGDSRIGGGKAAGLAALQQWFPELVPPGFVITVAAYRQFITENNLSNRIRQLLADLEAVSNPDQFRLRTETLREMIATSPVPAPIVEAMERQASATAPETNLWAVRSSALNEDEKYSFAGQFDSLLNIEKANLAEAYRKVLASRFSDRAILYRLHCGLREVETPMAVLFIPMIRPKAAGVIYTSDPQDPQSGNRVISTVPGLADKLVRGEEKGRVLYLSPDSNPTIVPHEGAADAEEVTAFLPLSAMEKLCRISRAVVKASGYEMDIEWALDETGEIRLLQGRRLRMSTQEEILEQKRLPDQPLFDGGYTLFPGRAEGPVMHLSSPDLSLIHKKGVIAVINQGTPEFAPILPYVGALLIAEGSPAGHLSALVREFSVPCMYQIEGGAKLLENGAVVSVDATRRRIYRGSRWPGVRDRVMTRVTSEKQSAHSGPLHDLVLELNLTDPFSSSFKAKKCRSIHDVIRFVHEMSVRSMFGFGDTQDRFWKRTTRRLESPLPIKLKLIDLDGSITTGKTEVSPDNVSSVPFQALWRGVSDPRVKWTRQSIQAIDTMPPDFVEQVMGGVKGPRRPSDTNYLIVAADYLNLNARFAFHYAMIDAIVGSGKENNHVHFRYRGGGAHDPQRIRRARFLEQVLRAFHFGVDRRTDLITAWLRNYDRNDCSQALEMLGRLMACSRQLDMFMDNDAMINIMVERFLNKEYSAFV